MPKTFLIYLANCFFSWLVFALYANKLLYLDPIVLTVLVHLKTKINNEYNFICTNLQNITYHEID